MSTSHQPTRSGSASSYNSASLGTSNNDGSLLSQAGKWLNKGSVGDMFGRMTTTQKVVGGALLAVGVGALLTNKAGKSKTGKATSSDAQTDTLNELLYFVNDRIEGYQRAVDESKDPQLSGYYKQLVSQSQQFSNELNGYLRQQGGGRQESTTVKGKFYRAWMDAKAALTGADEKAILGSNIYGEEWAIKAYEDALSDHTLSGTLRQAVERQYQHSQNTYKELQRLQGKQE
ncbi:ferritin-like domain-containing protein [Hymenobacter metallicola]|uniref:PA2169 family four-helix-bundle protein n=1 Tax=Hymenobacter metallicola TaxID=2563114 RepID=A0A4Z0Q1L2_9BACT|nr:PA2169 family four-helix-bundle protein [Hymenobacter metallicola]TGE23575.1 PA2169 family four-helix-bundle protein [Hymenobacter metallicola]